jgi:zinc protease
VLLGDPEAYLKDQREIQAATAADLQSAAQRWLSDGVYVLEVDAVRRVRDHTVNRRRTKLPDAQPAAGRSVAAGANSDLV